MTRPTVAQAEAWKPDALRETADDWDAAAADLQRTRRRRRCAESTAAATSGPGRPPRPPAVTAATISAGGAVATRCLITAAVAARDGADADGFGARRRAGCWSARLGPTDSRSPTTAPSPAVRTSPLLVSLAGGSAPVTRDVLDDADRRLPSTGLAQPTPTAASDIVEALNPPHAPPAPTAAAGAWPVPLADVVAGWSAIGQDRIANQIAAMTPEQRQRLIDEFPKQVGNTDGVPWDMRVAANRVNIAQAIADERRDAGPGRSGGSRSTKACSPRSTTRRAAAAGWTGRSSRSTPTGHR